LVGEHYEGGIENCYAVGVVSGVEGSGYIGGLIGYAHKEEYATVTHSYATGSVRGDYYVGGLIGYSDYCHTNHSYAGGHVEGYEYIGGLVGYCNGGAVYSSNAAGDVLCKSDSGGGLVGYMESGEVENCQFFGTVTSMYPCGEEFHPPPPEISNQLVVGWSYPTESSATSVITPDGKYALLVSLGYEAFALFDVEGNCLFGVGGIYSQPCVSNDGIVVAVVNLASNNIEVYVDGELIDEISCEDPRIALSGSGQYLAVYGAEDGLSVYGEFGYWNYPSAVSSSYNSLDISDNGLVVIGTDDNGVFLFGPESDAPILHFTTEHGDECGFVRISRNGEYIVAAFNEDNYWVLFDVYGNIVDDEVEEGPLSCIVVDDYGSVVISEPIDEYSSRIKYYGAENWEFEVDTPEVLVSISSSGEYCAYSYYNADVGGWELVLLHQGNFYPVEAVFPESILEDGLSDEGHAVVGLTLLYVNFSPPIDLHTSGTSHRITGEFALDWARAPHAIEYNLQISTDMHFEGEVYEYYTSDNYFLFYDWLYSIEPGVYYWRVSAKGQDMQGDVWSDWSAVQRLVVDYDACNIGGLIGTNYGSVTGSNSLCSVYGYKYVGGLAGYNNGRITHSYANGGVVGVGGYVGGLVGYNEGDERREIADSYFVGSVASAEGNEGQWGNYCGGLVGYNWHGFIARCYSDGFVEGGHGTGGLVGHSEGQISTSYSNMSVVGHGQEIGGLVGYNCHNVCDSYATGLVSGEDSVGGLIGFNDGYVGNCYSTGQVFGVGEWVGGLVGYGYEEEWNIESSFWDNETSGTNWSHGGDGKTTSEMKTIETFTDAGWDFESEWRIHPDFNNGYPFLMWQPVYFTLSLSSDPLDGGVVYVDFNQPSFWPIEIQFLEGSEVSIEAVPSVGHIFTEWSGDAEGGNNPIDITMDGNKNIVANFEAEVFSLNLVCSPDVGGTIDVAPSLEEYPYGTEVTLMAIPTTGYVFTNWSGDASGSENQIVITMDSDKSITANFEEVYVQPPTYYALTVNVNPAGSGAVSLSPSGGTYESGTQVTLTAQPAEGYVFCHWSGDASGTSGTIVVTMNSDKVVTAHFVTAPPPEEEELPQVEFKSVYTSGELINIRAGGSVTVNAPLAQTFWSVDISSAVELVGVTLSVHEVAHPAVPSPTGKAVLGYFEILVSANVGGVITFGMPEDAITMGNITDVCLMRYTEGGWQTLPTLFVRRAEGYYYYSASTDSFSLFAVAGTVVGWAPQQPMVPTVYFPASEIMFISAIAVFAICLMVFIRHVPLDKHYRKKENRAASP
jgi:PGF-pre-PGF domain-containing protein